MANPSVTYNFVNGSFADADQVDQNFQDLIDALTDGTKDITVGTLTVSGATVLNGHTTVGNSTVDDLTITASLASSVPVKTTNSYDFGSSTIAMRSFYLADSGSAARTTRLLGAAVASSWTMTLPTGVPAAARYRLESDASGVTSWQPRRYSGFDATNIGLAAATSANAIVIDLKGSNGSDPSSSNPVDVVFRHSTATTGQLVTRTITSAVTMTVNAAASLGFPDDVPDYIYVYLIDNAGTPELAVARNSGAFDDGSLVTTTAMSTSADSKNTMYSTSARTDVPCRLIGRIKAVNGAGAAWTGVTEVSVGSFLSSRTYRISAITQARVTAAAADALGEYRSYLRTGGGTTFSETNGSPGTAPSSTSGFLIYGGNAWANTDSNNEPSKYEVFVGKNKYVQFQFFNTTGFTGVVDTSLLLIGANSFGCLQHYDPTTGIATVTVLAVSSGTSGNFMGISGGIGGQQDGYFDILVSDMPF